MQNIIQLLEQCGEKFPQRTALVYNEKIITFKELHEDVLAFSNALENFGITHQTKVTVILPNVPEFVVSLFSIAQCGGVCVPLNPAYKKAELEYVLKDSETEIIITNSKSLKTILPLEAAKNIKYFIVTDENNADDPRIVSFEKICASANLPQRDSESTAPDDTACIIYTNAQSGYPLGAELTHKSLMFDAQKCVDATGMTERDVFLGALPFFHGFGVTTTILMAFTVGASVVIVEKFSPEKVLAMLEKEKVTFFTGVPAMFGILSMYAAAKKWNLSSLPYVISGGSALTKDIKERFESAFNVPVIEGYGLTECSPVVSFNPVKGINKFGSVGLPFPGITVKIVDEKGNELAAGKEGEVLISGDNVMKGYYKQTDETKKFLAAGWVHTGDMGKLDEEGYIYLTGLKKKMVLVGGLNVYCAEVERILKNHPKVEDAKLFSVDDELFGQLPNAEVVVAGNVEERELVDFCKENLASYKVPRKIKIIQR